MTTQTRLNNERLMKMALLAISAIGLIGCSSKSMVGDASLSSSGAAGDLACTSFSSSSGAGNFSAKIKDIAGNVVEILITEMPAAFFADSNYQLQTFPGQDIVTGDNLDSIAILNNVNNMMLVNRQTGASISIANGAFNVDRMREILQMSTQPTASDLSRISLKVVWGSKSSYPIVNLSLFNAGAIAASGNAIVPSFEANPNNYIASHPHLRGLQMLHPLYNYAAQGWSTEQYQARGQGVNCF